MESKGDEMRRYLMERSTHHSTRRTRDLPLYRVVVAYEIKSINEPKLESQE